MPPPDDILLNKAAIVERSLRRIREEFVADPALEHPTHRDALTLNIERACQAVIDSAMHLIAARHLGVPQSSAEAFLLLVRAGIISSETAQSMQAMTGFRNIAIHEYQLLDTTVLRGIAETRWQDLVQFFREIQINIRP
jgi:uncharacterized protein YutE (UPF0331/DUF86 family)